MSRNHFEDLYPLSPLQHGMLFHALYAPEGGAYVEQWPLLVEGALDEDALHRALGQVVQRHPALRTGFVWEGVPHPLQVVFRQAEVAAERRDWTDAGSEEAWKARLDAFLAEDRRRGFDLKAAPLVRLAFLRVRAEEWVVVFTFHHILIDAWAAGIVLADWFAFYRAEQTGEPLRLPPAPRYRDYIGWLQRRDAPAAEAFWRGALEGFTAPTPLPYDQGGAEVAEQHAAHRLTLDAVDSARLQAFAREQALTLNTVVLGAWGLLLARLGDTDDVVFGTTVSGRPTDLPGVERIVGLFINTLPVRVRIPEGATVRQWLGELQRWQAEARQYEHTPLVDVQRWTQIPRERPLFGSLAVFENAPSTAGEAGESDEAALRVTGLPMVEGSTFPLTLVIVPGERMELRLAYDARRFSADGARRILDGLAALLAALPRRADARVDSLSLVTENDRRELAAWGRGDAADAVPSIHRLIEAHAARTPDALALVAGDERLSYAELNRRANCVARRLVALGAGPEVRVAVSVERTADLVTGMLAVLKAGACYVPLDPAYPAERLAYMAADSGAAVLLVSREAPAGLAERVPAVLSLAADAGAISSEADEDLVATPDGRNLAYALYTSGSTGLPKGVMVPHSDAATHARAAVRVYGLEPEDRVLQFASASFDPAIEQVLAALTAGAAIVMRGADVPSPAELAELVRAEGVTVFNPPTAYWHELVRDPAACESVRRSTRLVLAGGEAMNPADARRWLATPGSARLLNVYGPAETVVTSTGQEVDARAAELPGAVSVGRPFPGRFAYVLRRDGTLAAPGEPGELFIGGLLARGYLGRPALTAERFVPDPFSAIPGTRMYATGDRARWTEDGRLAFLGRLDQQVKVRGFRVEPGEVEGALVALPGVAAAAVVARDDGPGGRALVAYVAPRPGFAPTPAELRRGLESALPEFLVPSAFVVLDALPMTPGGKVDRLALPAVERTAEAPDADFSAPRTETEKVLAQLWCEVLGVPRAGLDDSFFSLGGHSLSAMQVTSRIRQQLGVEVPLRVLFEAPTLAALAARVDAMQAPADSGPRMERVPRGDTAPLSFAQERLWFLERLLPGSPVYNIPLRVQLRGSVDAEAMRGALEDLVRRHEPLRTTLAERGGAAVQVILPPSRFDLPLTDLSHLDPGAAEHEVERMAEKAAVTPFDFTTGPLFRAHLVRHGAARWTLLMDVHHAVADGWSLGVFYRELGAFYEARLRGVRAALPALPVQYADFAEWQRAYLSGDRLEEQLAFWRERLAGAPVLELPTDRPRPAVSGFGGGSLVFSVPAGAASAVRELARTEEVTLFMPLLAALHLLLWKYTGETDHTVGSLVAGRTRAETEGLIGMFVNTLPLRTALTPELTFRELVRRVRETTLDAHAHQDLPFERLVDELGVERSLSRHPVFQVAFTVEERPHGQEWRMGDAVAVQPDSGTGTSKFDLTIGFTPAEDALFGGVEYATELFGEATVRRMSDHLVELLGAAVAHPDRPLRALPGLLHGADRQTLLEEWSGSSVPVPDAPVHVLVAGQAARTPDAPALVAGGSPVSYSEMNARANRLAHHLRARGARAESIVGIVAERSAETIIAILAVLKAGAAYLPLDPALPPARAEEMLADAGVRLLVDPEGSGAFGAAGVERVDLAAGEEEIAARPDTDPAIGVLPEQLAYVIYTSGSTGRPKGVAVPHRGVANLALASARRLELSAESRVLHFTSLAFDVSVSELFATLLSGAALVIAPREELMPGQPLSATLRTERITALHAPPSALAVTDSVDLPHLRAVLAGGEALSAAVAGRWGADRRLVNGYGPTESTVYAATAVVEADDPAPPIGTPVPNARLYVLDSQGDPLPAGIYGELHVGGIGVARGYLNRPALTAERFVPDAFSDIPGARLYRTGDRVRWESDGQLHYAGRMDDQVKIRGFRVEPGEAAARLAALPGVGDAIAVAHSDGAGDTRLVAYATPAHGAEPPSPEALRSALARTLPDYLVPSVIVVLDALPRTPTGKVDRRALPAPTVQGAAYVEPRTDTERMLAEVWSGLLEVERVGAEDSFFALGGHSLMATRMVSAIRERLAVDLPLRDVFETPRLDQLAARLDAALDPSLSDLLEDLEDLSDDELRALLAESATPGAEF